MGQLKVAFWNVQNLFGPGISRRGPQNAAEFDDKIAAVAAVVVAMAAARQLRWDFGPFSAAGDL